MRLFGFKKNKKGVALTYAVMVLLLLSTVIVAITALASGSYTAAVNSVADDQAFYYAKSIGLAVKQQFLDGYSINKILASLEKSISEGESNPVVEGTYSLEKTDQTDLVNGTIRIRYCPYDGLYFNSFHHKNNIEQYSDETYYYPYFLEVRVACLYQGALSVVTSIFSCEKDLEEQAVNRVQDAMDFYDVILTNTENASFGFSDSGKDSSSLNVYVYGKDDGVEAKFPLECEMHGELTTSGKASIMGYCLWDGELEPVLRSIKKGITSYGDLTLSYVEIQGNKGIHCDGNLTMDPYSKVEKNIYARGNVKLNSVKNYAMANSTSNGFSNHPAMQGSYQILADMQFTAQNVYAQGSVTMSPQVCIAKNIVARKNVTINGLILSDTHLRNPSGLPMLVYGISQYTGTPTYYTCGGGSYVGGSIYADGDVTISGGAYIEGDVIANGNVKITDGAFVKGDVVSYTGNVSVLDAGCVGGSVFAKKVLTVGMKSIMEPEEGPTAEQTKTSNQVKVWYNNVASWNIADATGCNVPGIGIMKAGCVHRCGQFVTYDTKYTTRVVGDLHVYGEAYSGKETIFGAIWILGKVYLETTRAAFTKAYDKNFAGNPSTVLYELYQHTDLYSGSADNPWLDLRGAWIGKIVCQGTDCYYDVFIYNGRLLRYTDGAALYGRCIGLANMDVDYGYNINARKWFQAAHWTGSETKAWEEPWTAMSAYLLYGSVDYSKYTYFHGNNEINILNEVGENYRGWAYTYKDKSANAASYYDQAIGGSVWAGVLMPGSVKINVGTGTTYAGDSSFTLYGGNQVYAKIHASVKTFNLFDNAGLSYGWSESDCGEHYAEIYANCETFNLYHNAPKEVPMGNSKLFIDGTAHLYGTAYTLYHYGAGNLTMYDNAKITKNFGSSSTGTIQLKGTLGNATLYNEGSVFSVTNDLTITGDLKLAGRYRNPTGKKLTVSGNMRIGKYSKADGEALRLTSVGKNLTVVGSQAGTPLSMSAGTVSGELFTSNITLTLNAGVTLGSVMVGSKDSSDNLTVSGATINGRCVATGTLLMRGGTLSGLVKGKVVDVRGGTLNGNGSSKVDAGTFTQANGTIKNYMFYISGSDPSGGKAFTATKGTIVSAQVNVPNGGVSITGGLNVNYTGVKIVAKSDSTIAAHYEGGAHITAGNLTIGSDSDTGSTYKVGSGLTVNKESVEVDNYLSFYAEKSLTWKGKAIPYTQARPSRAAAVGMTSKGNMTIGSAGNVVVGYFGDVTSLNGSVTAYVESIESINAKTTATVYATALCGGDSYLGGYGVKSGGNATISGGGTFKGVFEVGGTLTISDTIDAIARIKCAKIVGLEKITTKQSAKTSNYGAKVSLYLTGYKSSETFELKTSLVKNRSTEAGTDADTGSITVDPGNLKYSSSVKVEGSVWVDGTFTYNGSTENLISLGGIRCSNTNVNIAKEFKGSIDLPNVTSITLNANVSGQLRAPNVTTVNLNYDVKGVAEFPKVTSFTIKSGIKIGGIVIKSDGTVTNNGTVTGVEDKSGKLTLGGVECGKYTGSGTIGGGNLVIKGTSKSTIGGEVKANIWSKGPLKITANNLGASGTYVYSEGNIEAEGTTFDSGMSYIRSSGGNMYFKNCPSLPSVQNSSGYIKFSNDSSHVGTIKEVISTGKNILFGESANTNKITVTGNVDWAGSYTTTNDIMAIDGYRTNNEAVVAINGYVNCYGTGDFYSVFNIGGNLNLQNTGVVKLVGGTSVGGNLFINKDGQSVKKVTWESGASVAGYAFVYGTKTGDLKTIDMKGSVGQDLLVNNFDVACVYGTVAKQLVGSSCNDVTLKSDGTVGSVRMQLSGGRFYSYGKIKGNINAYDCHIWVKEGSIEGSVTLAASAADTYWCELGQKGKTVTVKGDIKVRGRLVDNTHNYGSIYCLGTYLGDTGKEWNDCGQINFTPESGWAWIFSPSNKDQNQMNSKLDIDGWLLISNKDDSHKIIFNNEIYCQALTVNTNHFDKTGSAGDYVQSFFGRSSGSYRENCSNGQLAGSLDKSSTNRHLVVFNKPVYVTEGDEAKGCCDVVNAEFAKGSMLVTDGQTCLSYCILYSQGFSADDSDHNWHQGNNVAYYDSNGNQDGSMFVHCKTTCANANFFWKTDTHSNVSVYNGFTYMNGACKFYGMSGSTSTGVSGSKLTKLFYFGYGLAMYGSGTGIYSKPPAVEKTPSARTIIWIPNGSLTVSPGTYIGKNVTKAEVTSTSTVYLEAKKNSSNPGVFVSNGSAWFYGTCTLDVYAKTQIVVDTGSVVTVKDYQSAGTRYFAGLYLSKGYLFVKKTDGNWYTDYSTDADDLDGFFGYFKCKEKGRHWYLLNDDTAGGLDDTAFTPNGSKYAAMLKAEINGSTTQDKNAAYYTPRTECPSRIEPTGIDNDTSVKGKITKNPMGAYTATSSHKPSGRLSLSAIPSQPSVSGLQDAQGGEMPKLKIELTVESWQKGTLNIQGSNPQATVVNKPTSCPSFSYTFATAKSGGYATEPATHDGTMLNAKRPADIWTSTIANNFDVANDSYWNPRVIPYAWTLPYSETMNTPARRVLRVKYEKSTGINLNWSNANVTEGANSFMVAQKAWDKSDLKSYITKNVVSYRSYYKSGSNYYTYFDAIKRRSTSGTDRITDMLIFESGELDYDAFVMGQGDDEASWDQTKETKEVLEKPKKKKSWFNRYVVGAVVTLWTGSIGAGVAAGFLSDIHAANNDSKWKSIPHSGLHGNHNKKIVGEYQHAWFQGGKEASYDIVWYFFTCEDPTDPYGSAPKDLHVVMPQGYGLEWFYDSSNTFSVIGKGRVFLYVTSGDTLYFFGSNADGVKPFGTVKKDKVGDYYQPQLYIIGAGTNIDFIMSGMPFYAYVYMPFGWSKKLYDSNGTLGYLNQWKDIAGAKDDDSTTNEYFQSTYYTKDHSKRVTDVKRNALTLGIDSGGAKRVILGRFVTDNFYYVPETNNKLTFVRAASPDLSDTTIYGRSIVENKKIKLGEGHKYSLSQFLELPPGFSTQMLNWKYVNLRVES